MARRRCRYSRRALPNVIAVSRFSGSFGMFPSTQKLALVSGSARFLAAATSSGWPAFQGSSHGPLQFALPPFVPFVAVLAQPVVAATRTSVRAAVTFWSGHGLAPSMYQMHSGLILA